VLFNGHLCPKKTGECTAFSGFFRCYNVLFSPNTSLFPSFSPSWNVFPEVSFPVLQALHSNVFAVREKGCIFLRFHVTALNAVTDRIKKYILKQISSIMKADFHPGSR